MHGGILHTAEHEFADDCCAIDMAERLAQRYEIKIWRYERLVANVEMGGSKIFDMRVLSSLGRPARGPPNSAIREPFEENGIAKKGCGG